MKIIEQHTVECCDKSWVCTSRYQALEKLLNHIIQMHPDEYAKLERRGRLEARSQNGCGYWDSDGANGWAKAEPTFRRAWIRTALKYKLKEPK